MHAVPLPLVCNRLDWYRALAANVQTVKEFVVEVLSFDGLLKYAKASATCMHVSTGVCGVCVCARLRA